MWSVTTNPFKSASRRKSTFEENFLSLKNTLLEDKRDISITRSYSEYKENYKQGKHSAFMVIQGGNSIESYDSLSQQTLEDLLRVTLIHFTKSSYGRSSVPKKNVERGLTQKGKEFVEFLNSKKIFVDLAHISEEGFYDALEVHDKSIPPIVTHTGVKGQCDHWRNLTDKQVKAIADRGGVIGIMFQKFFLDHKEKNRTISRVVDHIEHTINIGGESCVAIGSDFDGMIMPPRGINSILDLPKLVDEMLQRKWSEKRIQGVLGRNFINSLKLLRP